MNVREVFLIKKEGPTHFQIQCENLQVNRSHQSISTYSWTQKIDKKIYQDKIVLEKETAQNSSDTPTHTRGDL